MKKWIYFLLIALFSGTGVMLKYSTSHEHTPIGCDEFGYLQLSKSINEGSVFSSHDQRPWLNGLLEEFRDSGLAEIEFAWMVAPHAYHLIPHSNQIINTYPPGTSLIISFIPIAWRQIMFPLVMILLLVIIPFSISYYLNKNWNVFDIVYPVFIFLASVAPPFITELARINSVAPTLGLLIGAGMLLVKKPVLSLFLIALSANFRIANIILILPVFLFMFQNNNLKLNIKIVVKSGFIIFIALLPIVIYNSLLTGNPFQATYSDIDTEFGLGKGVIANTRHYFDWNNYWLRVHLVSFAMILLTMLFTGRNIKVLAKILCFPALNYMFFIFHNVTTNYYTYASAIIMIGFAFGYLIHINIPIGKYKYLVVGAFSLSVIILISGALRYNKRSHITTEEAKQKYLSLCAYDIVWADMYSGTAQYVCDNNGLRYSASSLRARRIAFNFFYKNNLNQAILVDDIKAESSTIVNELHLMNFEFSRINDPWIGRIIEVNKIPVN